MALVLLLSQLAALAAGSTLSLSREASVSLKERPIMKVIRLLKDMETELEKGIQDDKDVHAKLGCWCETGKKEKSTAIEMGEQRSEQLKSQMDEATAKKLELTNKRESTWQELQDNIKSLGEARALRAKENKAFHAENVDTLEAIKACEQAITVLSKHNKPPSMLIQQVVSKLTNARVSELSLGRLRPDQMSVLKSFLQQPASYSFLAQPAGGAGFQSYGSQSGQIFGVLNQMLDDFKASLGEEEAAEKKAQEQHEALVAEKRKEIETGKKLVVSLDKQIADTSKKHAQDLAEYQDTQKQLGMDKAFLEDLNKKCAQSEDDFNKRMKSREEEKVAVLDTIKILNDDEAFANFDKTVNTPAFVQTASMNRQEEVARRNRAVSVLRLVASQGETPTLALLAASAQLDAFEKVKAEIDRMVAELKKQQKDEVAERDECIKLKHENTANQQKADEQKAKLETSIASLTKSIETLTSNIKESQTQKAELQDQMKRASETREAQHAEFATTVRDQRMTQMILNKALTRMQEVYALMQESGAPHIQTSGTHTDAGNGPAKFTKYEQNAGGGKVVAMLKNVIADSRKLEDEAIRSEHDDQSGYEFFMQESNDNIKQLDTSISDMKGTKAGQVAELTDAKADSKTNMQEQEKLHELGVIWNDRCQWLMSNFDKRQAARVNEMEGLGEAKAILSGMK